MQCPSLNRPFRNSTYDIVLHIHIYISYTFLKNYPATVLSKSHKIWLARVGLQVLSQGILPCRLCRTDFTGSALASDSSLNLLNSLFTHYDYSSLSWWQTEVTTRSTSCRFPHTTSLLFYPSVKLRLLCNTNSTFLHNSLLPLAINDPASSSRFR